MKLSGKLIPISVIARLLLGNLLYHRALTRTITALICVVVIGVLTGALLIGGLFIVWLLMVDHNIGAIPAALWVGAAMLLIIAALVAFTMRSIHRLKDALLFTSVPDRISNIAEAFMEGFNEPADKAHRR